MTILGLNAYHADASAALLRDGEVVAAVEEERLNRVKHCAGFPALAAKACLEMAGASASDLDHVAVSRDPSANMLRKVLSVLGGNAPTAMLASRLSNAAKVRKIEDELAAALGVPPLRAKVHAVEHHRAHLASAYLCSPFEEAAVLSIDGFGDFVSTMFARGRGASLEVLGAIGYPHSLGILYTATSQWLGFDKYGDEGKVMGLAPYGTPCYVDRLRRACDLTDDGFALDVSFFTHATEGVAMTWDNGSPVIGRLWSPRFIEELGPPRAPGAPLTEHHHDVAASLQALTEEVVIHLARLAHAKTGARRLCLAGGVALNSVANGKLRAATPFDEIFVQPAAGDNGTSLGAALWVEHAVLARPRRFIMSHASTGPAFAPEACAAALERAGLADIADITRVDDEAELCERTAQAIADGLVVGWFQGRMEFGPRALGNRSVLADPRRADMKDTLNRRIKHREPFRPFAPAILAERTADWFLEPQPSPAMLMVLPFRPEKRALVPAVAHVDGSGRLQTVERAHNPLYHGVIAAFERLTGVPIVLNTSFNENEPIVCTPDEAIACFQRTAIDLLVLGPFFARRRST
ncbi:MAG TPA: carbamoyltransferase C-terminal domain-containing protein [Kofleriaceae bacterium]|nr:carbamoyltransferase C-terminal domain-containing protein [Kofleriaceae bacterium]